MVSSLVLKQCLVYIVCTILFVFYKCCYENNKYTYFVEDDVHCTSPNKISVLFWQ